MSRYVTVRKGLDKRSTWFGRLRFGVFMHFGLYSVLERHEWAMRNENIPREEYRKLMKRFNPKRFRAENWIDFVKRAGARYLVLTAKHHDGFCLFDSALTDYKITNTPFGRDLIKEVVDACHRARMRIVLYYSQPDWAHPNYVHHPGCGKDLPSPVRPSDTPDWPKYLQYLFGQVEELCTNYGRIDGIWFDGLNKPESRWHGRELYRLIKRHQPHAVVNDRTGYGDFYTPERRLSTAPASMGYMVEATDCVAKGAWSFMPDAELRSSPSVIQSLVRMAGAGGNYLLNIGPKPDGTLPKTWVQRFDDVGAWLREYGASIFETQGCPRSEETPDQFYTRKGKRVYLHLLRWPETNQLKLSRLSKTPRGARVMGSKVPLTVERIGDQVVLKGLPALPPNSIANVIELECPSASSLRRAGPWPTPAPLKFDGVAPLEIRLTDAAGVFLSFKGLPLPTFPFRGLLPEDLSNIWMPEHRITWQLENASDTTVNVDMEVACGANSHGSAFAISAGKQHLIGTIPDTQSWGHFVTVHIGKLRLRKGRIQLKMVPQQLKFYGRFGILRKLILTPADRFRGAPEC